MRENIQTQNFIDQLIEAGIVRKDETAPFIDLTTPEDVFEALLARGISGGKMAEEYGKFRGIPYVSVLNLEDEAREIIDPLLAKKFGFVPFNFDKNTRTLQVAMDDPRKILSLNRGALINLGEKIGCEIEVVISSKIQIEKALSGQQISPQLPSEKIELQQDKTFINPVNIDFLKRLANESDAHSLMLALLKYGYDKQADALLIEPFQKNLMIRVEVDGLKRNIITLPSNILDEISLRTKTVFSLQYDSKTDQSGKASLNLGGEGAQTVTVSILPTIFGERILFKFLKSRRDVPSFSSLNIFEKIKMQIEEELSEGYGIFLISGPSSSGKTTTLYSFMKFLADREKEIISLEDEALYDLPEISQVEVNPQIGFGYPEALDTSLKQDPDVVMIDEIKDSETAKIAVSGALLGKVLLLGMYSSSAAQAIYNFSSLCQESFAFSASVKFVLCQRLVRAICPKCRERVEVSKETEERIMNELGTEQALQFYRGVGCENCRDGYKGRLAIFEIVKPSDELKALISSGATLQDLSEAVKSSSIISMRQDGFLKAVSGLTTLDEVIKVTKR